MDSITPEQKEAAKAEINQIVEDSKEAIDTATTVDAIQTSVEDGKHAIDNVVTEAKTQDAFAKAQNDAKKALDDKATEAKAAIDAMDSITPEQKEAAKAEINQIVEDSKEAIDTATTVDAIQTIVEDGKKAIDDVVIKTQKDNHKNQVIKDLEDKAEKAKELVDNMNHLTPNQKETAKHSIDQELSNGLQLIEKGNIPNTVIDASGQAIDKIVAEARLQDAKNEASVRLKEVATKAIETIKASDLTQSQKENAIKEVEGILEGGLTAIGSSANLNEVKDNYNIAVKAINEVLKIQKLPETGVGDGIGMYLSGLLMISGLGVLAYSKRKKRESQ